ncbi:hypothetical protein ASPWEDRAFT_597338 [Aspergillus wentii DTO 134E9]|uniref:Uncharacterized protein n=1 Tax=Aspergillus wentii DTO 134E9 TaxID=1073089 RepID=A0A1L9RDE8_ASPWE|nr:uncharacterized protein ASPWEDRAFT_597338 [Aspergillus wentii DTO 134E9]OJJ32887.1 hypothetical protein ASPWEDRAFT_597338 [Aspergillus wentii DTO 134E9]
MINLHDPIVNFGGEVICIAAAGVFIHQWIIFITLLSGLLYIRCRSIYRVAAVILIYQ